MIKHKKIDIATMAYIFALLGVGLLVGIGILIYGFGMENAVTKKSSQIFPYPAAVVSGVNFITLKNLDKNVEAVRKFYEDQDFSRVGLSVDFNSADGQKRLAIKKKDVLTKMVEDRVIEILANKRGIVLTQAAVTQEVQKRAAEFGEQQALVENIQKLYGWNVAEFEQKIVKPELYKDLLAKDVQEKEKVNLEIKKKIDTAASELKKSTDFAALAKKYSDGESAQNGGELGWFSADQMLPEIGVVAYALNVGEISEVIKSPLGYHIIQLESKKTEEGIEKVQLRQIFVRIPNFAEWLLEQEKDITIYIPLKGLYWDKTIGRIEFSSKELQKFEENVDSNSADDASMLF